MELEIKVNVTPVQYMRLDNLARAMKRPIYGTFVDGKDLNELIRQALRTEEAFAGSIMLTVTDLSEKAKITRIGGNDQTNVDSAACDCGMHESCIDASADCGVAAE